MARTKGTFNFSANLEPKVQAPLDARTVVDTVAELRQAATWQDTNGDVWLFDGLVVSIAKTGELYMLTNKAAYTSAASWKRIDGGGAESDVYMVGDISTLTTSSQPTDIKGILGTPAALKAAVKAGKVIVVRSNGTDDTQNALYAVQVSYSSANTVAINGTFGVGYLYIELTGTGDAWTSVNAAETKELAFKPDVVQSVTATANKGIEIGGTTTKPTVGVKIDNSGNVNLSTSANGLKAQFNNPVTGVLGSDKFLTLSSTLINATVGLDYDQASNKIRLLGKGNAVVAEVDASPFTKDEKLQSVSMSDGGSGRVIRFTVGSGDDTETVDLPLSQLFIFKEGIKISADQTEVMLSLDPSSEPYLTVSSAGLKLAGIDAAIAEAIQEVSGGIVASVTATADKGIEVAGTATNPTIGLKIDSTGNVKLSTGANGLKASYEDFATGIDATDQVLTANATKLKANLGLQYDSEAKQIKLTGKSNAVIATIDATDFIKDGMVQSVELEGNNLVITFNTDAGAEPISVDLSKFLDVYTAGNGITISGKSIAVKPYMGLVADSNGVAVNINSGDKYLGFSAGALVSKGIDAAIEAAITEAFSWHEVGE